MNTPILTDRSTRDAVLAKMQEVGACTAAKQWVALQPRTATLATLWATCPSAEWLRWWWAECADRNPAVPRMDCDVSVIGNGSCVCFSGSTNRVRAAWARQSAKGGR